jgi:MscS family membrane protein
VDIPRIPVHAEAFGAIAIAILAGLLVWLLARPVLRALVARTHTTLDDLLLNVLPRPLALSTLLFGLSRATVFLDLSGDVAGWLHSALQTIAVLLWTQAAMALGRGVMEHQLAHPTAHSLLHPRTLPLYQLGIRVFLYGGAVYLLMLAWNIDVTAWMASAGVVGIAVGFASKDSLANLFAGLFIVADTPYSIGDFLVIDDRTRGRVTHIGLRSTRIVTRDDIELVVPNSLMASARVTNESSGPVTWMRVRCPLLVGYDDNLEEVRAVLEGVARTIPLLVQDDPERTPRVRFRSFEDAGVRVEVLGWIRRSEDRGIAIDALVVGISKALREAGFTIPFPQRVVHMVVDPAVPTDD